MMDLNAVINAFQTLLNKGLTSLDAGGLSWLNVTIELIFKFIDSFQTFILIFSGTLSCIQDVCVDLTTICKHLHKFLIFDSKANDKVIQTCFLCLNQMICCIKYLETTLKKEQKAKIVLAVSTFDWYLKTKRSLEYKFILLQIANASTFS